MATTSSAGKTGTIVVSALRARANFGKLLRRVDDQSGSLVIEKRGIPEPCCSAFVIMSNWPRRSPRS